MSIKTDILWRVGLVYLAITVFAILIAGKIIYLQLIDDDQWKEEAGRTRIMDVKISPQRGDIYSADMRLLASSVPLYEVRIDLLTEELNDTIFRDNLDSFSASLSNLFGNRTKAEYKERLVNARRKGNRYLQLKNKVNYAQLKKLKEFPVFELKEFNEGLIVIQENVRRKPHKNLASRTIGYTTKSLSGNIVGIEGAYDQYLGGVEGLKRMHKLYGDVWMPLDGAGKIEPHDGSSVVTTIDIDMQDIAQKALIKQMKEYNAKGGTVVLMEVKTGDIKAIVNLTDTFGAYREYYNYAVGRSSEPGSTFKLPALLTALEDGFVHLDDTIDTGNGLYNYFDVVITDWKKGGFGKLTVEEIFEKSSNIGMVKIITDAYAKQAHRFIDRLYSMKLNEPLGISIRGEGAPFFQYPGEKYWTPATLSSMSYGYALKVTPLQTLTLYNAIANDGKMVKPRFVTEIRNHGKIETTFPPVIINPSICSKPTIRMARKMMEGVVETGTAHRLKTDLVKVAGKTGTNRMYNVFTGYDKKSHQASFVGYFPADKPKYSCIVVVYSPQGGSYHGSDVAAPAFFEVASKVYITDLSLHIALNDRKENFLEIPFSKNGYQLELSNVLRELDIRKLSKEENAEWVATERTDEFVALNPIKIIKNLVPNVVSMGLKDAVYLLENLGLHVEVTGRGSVRHQSLPAGSRVNSGQIIQLEMSFTEG